MKRLFALLITGLFLGACSGDSKPNPTPAASPTAQATADPRTCPTDAAVCVYALVVEHEARAGAIVGVFPETRSLGERARDMLAVTGGVPRVTSIGCPLREGEPNCSREFVVTVTSLTDDLIERDTRGLVAIFFSRGDPPIPFALFEAPVPTERRLFVDGGERDFDRSINRGGDQPRWRFFKFETGVTPEVKELGKLPPIREVFGATSTVMTLGEPYSIQQGEVWYFKYLCDACGPGPFPNLYRAYRAANGTLVVDDLKAKALSLGTPVAFTADWQSGTVYLATCEPGVNCYSLESGGADSQKPATVYKSVDGGVTWKRDGEIPPRTALSATGRDEALATTYADNFSDARYWFYPTGREFELPQRVTDKVYPGVLTSGTIVWRSSTTGIYYDQAGTALFGPLFDEKFKPRIAVADPQYQHTYLTWAETDFKIGWASRPYYSYVARVDRDGQMKELFGLPGDTMWISGEFPRQGDGALALFGRFRFGTTVDYERDVSFGAVLDLANGKVRRFTELDAARPRGSFVWMEDLVRSVQFYRVTGAGDCLNIRESPTLTGRVIACLADDVLVGGMETSPQTANGIEWRFVGLPDKRSGWASTEFLR